MSTIEASIPAEILELSPYAPTRSTIKATPLNAEELQKTFWRLRGTDEASLPARHWGRTAASGSRLPRGSDREA